MKSLQGYLDALQEVYETYNCYSAMNIYHNLFLNTHKEEFILLTDLFKEDLGCISLLMSIIECYNYNDKEKFDKEVFYYLTNKINELLGGDKNGNSV